MKILTDGAFTKARIKTIEERHWAVYFGRGIVEPADDMNLGWHRARHLDEGIDRLRVLEGEALEHGRPREARLEHGEPHLGRGIGQEALELVPLRGVEAYSEEMLVRSFRLDYPAYELIFCVADPADPIVPMVERLIEAGARGTTARQMVDALHVPR